MAKRHHFDALQRSGLGAVMLLVALTAASVPVHGADGGDPLARAEFNKEISVDIKDADVIDVFRLIARVTEVPFVLEFDNDPSLRVTLKAKNMVCRGVLASVAGTTLEYSSTDEGIVVRRRGSPAVARRTTVGAWPVKAGPPYRLDFVVRDAEGHVLYRPTLSARMGVVGKLTLGLQGRDVTVLDRDRSIAEPRYVGGLELAICVTRDTANGLDLLLELVTKQPLSETRYAEEHAFAKRIVPVGETLLFKTQDGHEIRLSGWSRSSEGPLARP